MEQLFEIHLNTDKMYWLQPVAWENRDAGLSTYLVILTTSTIKRIAGIRTFPTVPNLHRAIASIALAMFEDKPQELKNSYCFSLLVVSEDSELIHEFPIAWSQVELHEKSHEALFKDHDFEFDPQYNELAYCGENEAILSVAALTKTIQLARRLIDTVVYDVMPLLIRHSELWFSEGELIQAMFGRIDNHTYEIMSCGRMPSELLDKVRREHPKPPAIMNCSKTDYVSENTLDQYIAEQPFWNKIAHGFDTANKLWQACVPHSSDDIPEDFPKAFAEICMNAGYDPTSLEAEVTGDPREFRLRILEESIKYLGIDTAYDAYEAGVPITMIGI